MSEFWGQGLEWDTLLSIVSNCYQANVEGLKMKSKAPGVVKAHSMFCYLELRKWDRNPEAIACRLNITPSAVSRAVMRGQILVREKSKKVC